MSSDVCPHCQSSREVGCKFGCPQKQPPRTGSPVSYEQWAAGQKEQHARTCETCMRPWKAHTCPTSNEEHGK